MAIARGDLGMDPEAGKGVTSVSYNCGCYSCGLACD